LATGLTRFEYSASAAHGEPLNPNRAWSPEDLLLAGLVKCTLASLAFFAERRGIESTGSGAADGVVAKRESDGRYAFAEIVCGLDVELEPRPDHEKLSALLDSAEWGCFIGASLTVKPRYEWRVNGEVVGRKS
jgi:organic hydroperoxide reductase OsmC/OhrA